jgi:WD40 repeat protein
LLIAWLALTEPGTAAGASTPARKPVRTDRYGDPLPAGALARLGTVRLRHAAPVLALAFSPDGKRLASGSRDQTVRVWDVATGRELRRPARDLGEVTGVAFTADGKTVISGSMHPKGGLRAWDLHNGKEVRSFGPFPEVNCLALSADGKVLAAANRAGKTGLWDVASGKLLRHFSEPDSDEVLALAFSPDGKTLATGTRRWRVVAREVANGKLLRELRDRQEAVGAVAFTADGTGLLVGGEKGVTLWDIATEKRLHTLTEESPWPRSFCRTCGRQVVAWASGPECHLWDLEQRKEIRRDKIHTRLLHCVACSPDGRLLASAGEDHAIRIRDAATGAPPHAFAAHPAGEVRAWAFPGGKWLLYHPFANVLTGPWVTADGTGDRSWGPTNRPHVTPLHGIVPSGEASPVLSPRGDRLAIAEQYGQIHLLELGRSGGDREPDGTGWPVAYSQDGGKLAVAVREGTGKPYRSRVWDTAAGRWLPGEADWACSPITLVHGGIILVEERGGWQRFLDRFYYAATGREVPASVGNAQFAWEGRTCFTLSGDGRIAVFCQKPPAGWDSMPETLKWALPVTARGGIHVFEPLTAKTAFWLDASSWVVCVGISTDGRLVAAGEADGGLRVWDLTTGKVVRRFDGHTAPVSALVFSWDGKELLSGSEDGTALVWDLAGCRAPSRENRLKPGETQSLWSDLASGQAGTAYRAIHTLSRDPRQAVPFLKERLRLSPVPEAARMARLLADLDSGRYAVRERATKKLGKLGWTAVPMLRAALKKVPPLEVRRRVEKLLSEVGDPADSSERLRALRAVACLERVGNAEACAALQTLAQGPAQARLTLDARAAVRRLALRRAPGD